MVSPSECSVAAVPTNPLVTSITGNVPIPVIGPRTFVDNPTLSIRIISLSTFAKSLGRIDEIPERPIKVTAAPIVEALLSNLKFSGVYVIGYWLTPSTVIKAFSSFFFISSLW